MQIVIIRVHNSEHFIKLFWLIANLRDWKLSRKHFIQYVKKES